MSEKILKLQEQIEKSKEKIAAEQSKIDIYNKKIKMEKELDIKNLVETIDLPYNELKIALEKIKAGLLK